MKNNDFDFINEKFNEAKIDIPKELDDKVEEKLKNATPKIIKFNQKTWFKTTVSLVASLALFVSALTFINGKTTENKVVPSVSTTPTASAFDTFESYDELQAYIKKNTKKDVSLYGLMYKSSTDKLAVDEELNEDVSSDTSVDNAQTYIQEKGVDEADVIKTYKGYIYTVSNDYDDENYVYLPIVNITKTMGKATEKASTIKLDKGYNVQEIYVYDDTLVAIETKGFYGSYYYDGLKSGDNDKSLTKAVVYDVSNPEQPKKLNSFTQSGNYSNSRMINDNLYLVTNYGIYYDRFISSEEYAPFVCKNDGENQTVSCNDIAYQPNSSSNDFVVVSAFDVQKGKQTGKTKAMLGWGMDVYCSLNNLYVYCSSFNAGEETEIAKISLDDGVDFVEKTSVKGSVESSYSFSENNGKLCVFTTVYNYDDNGRDKNYLYVLDENLKQIYKSKSFAENESIKAVKYIGDYAYVITYEQTDPLFVIDLKNVENPVFMGEVKISGFSEMLVDVGDNMLLGIGYSTHYGKEVGMEVTDGLKFALFDVSNPNEPKVLDSKEYKGYSSDVFYNPKALTVNANHGTYSVPFYDDYGKNGALVVSIKDKKIVENKNIKFSAEGYDVRISFVDDFYYLVDVENADVIPFKI